MASREVSAFEAWTDLVLYRLSYPNERFIVLGRWEVVVVLESDDAMKTPSDEEPTIEDEPMSEVDDVDWQNLPDDWYLEGDRFDLFD